jgi:hypothetical protein
MAIYLTEVNDATTPLWRMKKQLVGAFAEFESAKLRERTMAGLDAVLGYSKSIRLMAQVERTVSGSSTRAN